MKQQKRTSTFFDFCHATSGILFCTDVAARGLDIPEVDWIVQYDPPDDPKEYIHRVGRTARGLGSKGRALLFMLPEEVAFLHYLKKANIPMEEFVMKPEKIVNVQPQLERLISGNFYLGRTAKEAFRAYLQAYSSHSMKQIFDVYQLNLLLVAKAFGFDKPPKCDLALKMMGKKVQHRGKIGAAAADGADGEDSDDGVDEESEEDIRPKKVKHSTELRPGVGRSAAADDSEDDGDDDDESDGEDDDDAGAADGAPRRAPPSGRDARPGRKWMNQKEFRSRKIRGKLGGNHGFSAANPYGIRQAGDKRQFSK
jgi:superfamily II DNA/RNA helicase